MAKRSFILGSTIAVTLALGGCVTPSGGDSGPVSGGVNFSNIFQAVMALTSQDYVRAGCLLVPTEKTVLDVINSGFKDVSAIASVICQAVTSSTTKSVSRSGQVRALARVNGRRVLIEGRRVI